MDIKEKVVEELPVKELYSDLVQPSARRLGKTAEDILKFVSLPFSFLGMTSEELEKKYKTFITSALNKVPEEKREKPSPLIAGPLLDHIKFLFNDENEKPLEEMFSELLKNACTKDTKKSIQPAYIYSLKQITWVEANLLRLLFNFDSDIDSLGCVFKKLHDISDKVIHVYSKDAEPLHEYIDDDYSNVFFQKHIPVVDDGLEISAAELRAALNILEQLNLVKRFTINKYRNKNEYSLEEHDVKHAADFDPYNQLTGFSLTAYARDMMRLCTPDEKEDYEFPFICTDCGCPFSYQENITCCPYCKSKNIQRLDKWMSSDTEE